MDSFDSIIGSLRCSFCGQKDSENSTTIRVKLLKQPSQKVFECGDWLDVDWDNVCIAGYHKLTEPDSQDCVTILETWECTKCAHTLNWARIGIENSEIQSVESVELSVELLRSTTYLSNDLPFLMELQNLSIDELALQLKILEDSMHFMESYTKNAEGFTFCFHCREYSHTEVICSECGSDLTMFACDESSDEQVEIPWLIPAFVFVIVALLIYVLTIPPD